MSLESYCFSHWWQVDLRLGHALFCPKTTFVTLSCVLRRINLTLYIVGSIEDGFLALVSVFLKPRESIFLMRYT